MATLTRSVGVSVSNAGIVLPLSRLSSIALFQNGEDCYIQGQKLLLQKSPIGGLKFGWKSVKSFSAEELGELEPLKAFHAASVKANKFLFQVNEPELWIPRPMYGDHEIWASLLFEVLLSGIGFNRRGLFKRISKITTAGIGQRLVDACQLNKGIEKIFFQLMNIPEAKQAILKICKEIENAPHTALGIKWSNVKMLRQSEIQAFQKCRPFWATDMDKLEELLQIPPSDIFVVMREAGTSWVPGNKVSWMAARNLGYVIPKLHCFVPHKPPFKADTILEVKPDVCLTEEEALVSASVD